MSSGSSRSAARQASAKFAQIYESLPADIRLALLEEQLIPLIDSVSEEKSGSVISAAIAFQARFQSIPPLDLKGKKNEVNTLLDGLQKDSKISIKDRSDQQELLEELFDSLTSWLNNIWSVVYEHHFGYLDAHRCRCSVMNMSVNVTIKNQGGKVVKDFAVSGPRGIERILLWIWRDLFVSLLARGTSWDKKKIPEMMESIESVMDWTALERLLYGGKQSLFKGNCSGADDEDDEDSEDNDNEVDEDETGEDDEDDEEEEEEDNEWGMEAEDKHCEHPSRSAQTYYKEEERSGRLHASHWTSLINDQRLQLQQIVEARLHSIFEISPSLRLFMTILSISRNMPETHQWLFSTISQTATSTPETFVASLEIFSAESEVSRIVALLDSHSHLLRPRDAQCLQLATVCISESPKYHARAIPVIIRELADSIRQIHAAVRSAFSYINEAKHEHELTEILKLRAGRVRRARMEAWVEAVSSPPPPMMHPMAIAAAMIMGLPMPPPGALGDDPELIASLDLGSSYDRDLEDLRDEFRPRLSERFDGWCKVTHNTKGGSALLADAHARVVKLMPFLRAPDVVHEMMAGLEDRSSMSHIYAALEALSSFCKTQQKIIIRRTKEKKANTSILHL